MPEYIQECLQDDNLALQIYAECPRSDRQLILDHPDVIYPWKYSIEWAKKKVGLRPLKKTVAINYRKRI